MSLVRVLMRGSILVLFGCAAVVAMTILFRAQMRFDQQAELQMKVLEAPSMTPTMTLAGTTSTSAQAAEAILPLAARATGQTADPPVDEETGETTASVRLTPLTPVQVAGLTGITSPSEKSARPAPEPMPAEGKNAVTIPVRKSESARDAWAADRWVDVVLTHQMADGLVVNDVVVQNARVLAVDRVPDTDERPATSAVTLEVDTEGAQKLLLATRIGTLSLILRANDDRSLHEARPVSSSDLIKTAPTPEQANDRFTSVRVSRAGAEPSVHRVPKER